MAFSKIILGLSILSGALAAPVAEPAPMPAHDFDELMTNSTLRAMVRRATAVDYNQDYIASGAGVTYTPNLSAGSFKLSWNTNQDFVTGIGWKTGDDTLITYTGSFSVQSGTPGGLLSVYGWTTNPLVEYYVVENQGNGYSTGGSQKGTLTSDGSTYAVWEHTQSNQPSILGTSTFSQYISLRQTPRSSGTVTLANHFKAWASFGMNLGTMNFQTISVESWSGAGSASLAVSKGAAAASSSAAPAASSSAAPPKSSSASSAPAKTSSAAPVATSATSSAPAVQKYGQCGGQGYTGSTTCASGSKCTVSNQWYSQCL
ncbi:hypothetical protein LTR17_024256 [Elasticomyces elasticus]|nr:hypothetical protein LTR17_024256 [Elasticomyces elasticus]